MPAQSAALGLLFWWVDQDFRYGPTRLARMYQQLATTGLLGTPDHDHPLEARVGANDQ